MQRMLVTGASGLLGREIVRVFGGAYEMLSTDVNEFDITDPGDCRRVIGGFRPAVVVHCAAYTAVDRAESEKDRAMEVNRDGTGNVARECRRIGVPVVTFGSDYVFDGSSSRPYVEEDAAHPLSAYGRSKWEAEEILRAEAPDHLLVRSQWLFGPHGRNFIVAIIEKAGRGEPLRVVCDQKGCPTSAGDLAHAVKRLLDAGARGTFHFSNGGEATWYDLAVFVLERFFGRTVPVTPARASELSYPAPRPAYSVLGKEKYMKATGDNPRRWEEAVAEYLKTVRERGITGR